MGRMSRMSEMIMQYRILVGKSERKRPLGVPTGSLLGNIKPSIK
jgi:hypothetical protein